MNSFHIKAHGCKVNQCDAQEIRRRFLLKGWQEALHPGQADICVVNTCCVTQRADRKSRVSIREAVRGRDPLGRRVIVVGCYPGYDPLSAQRTGVEAIFSNEQKPELYRWIDDATGPIAKKMEGQGVVVGCRTRGFLKVQEGCDYRCSYCVVPMVRGASRSVPLDACLAQARRLVISGHREIVVTGVSLGAYGRDLCPSYDLADLLEALEEVKGLDRIRLSSIEPMDITRRLIDKMASSSKCCPHLHIPFQSGDDAILKHMNRRMTVADYKELVRKIRHSVKDVSITCDMIAGYPIETEASVKRTLAFLDDVGPLRTHVFTFSLRRGTALAQAMIKPLSRDVTERFRHAYALKAAAWSAVCRRHFIGRTMEVLFEDKQEGLWQGYAGNYVRVAVKSRADLHNQLCCVRLNGLEGDDLVMGGLCPDAGKKDMKFS